MYDHDEMLPSAITQLDREFTMRSRLDPVTPVFQGWKRPIMNQAIGQQHPQQPQHPVRTAPMTMPSSEVVKKETEPSLIPLDDSCHSSCWMPIDFGEDDDEEEDRRRAANRRRPPPPRSFRMDSSSRSLDDDSSNVRGSRNWGTPMRRLTRSKSSYDGVPLVRTTRLYSSDQPSSSSYNMMTRKGSCRSVDGGSSGIRHHHASHLSVGGGSSVGSFDDLDYLSDESYERKAPPSRTLSWDSWLSKRGSNASTASFTMSLKRYRFRLMAKLYLLGPLIQTVLIFGFVLLVVRSRRSSAIFEEQLRMYNHETSSLLLKLQRIEHNSQTLDKHIGHHLGQAGVEAVGSGVEEEGIPVLSEDLHGKASELQEAIQERDYMNIVERYGEGPIKLVFDLELSTPLAGGASTTVDIVLWSDTPHASWALLDQIERGLWDGAKFHWNPQLAALDISPTRDDPQGKGQLEFAEHISDEDNWHDAWTVGLRQDSDTRRLQLFFNLKDNSDFLQHETCVGRVLAGFDALQTALRSVSGREMKDGSTNQQQQPSISVRKAMAKHLTRREMAMTQR